MVDQGTEFELRVARLEFALGAYVRTRVPVRHSGRSNPGRDILTDADVYSIAFDDRLRITTSNFECKSVPGQRGEADRLFWLLGLQNFLKTDSATLVRLTISTRGRELAEHLGIVVQDDSQVQANEQSHRWVPERFGELGGAEYAAFQSAAIEQLKRFSGELPPDLIANVTTDYAASSSTTTLNSLLTLERALSTSAMLPAEAARYVASHAFMALVLSALKDASRLNDVDIDQLREEVELGITTGNRRDNQSIRILSMADELLRLEVQRVERLYQAAGVDKVAYTPLSLRGVVAETPLWIPEYLDLCVRLNTNPSVARLIPQTLELALFEAMPGGSAYLAPAFDHLFTAEHQQLVAVSLRVAESLFGKGLKQWLEPALRLDWTRIPPVAPDRSRPFIWHGSPKPDDTAG